MKVKLQNHFLRVLEFCKSAMSKCLIIPFNSAFFGEVKKSPTYNNARTSFIYSRDVNHLFYSVPIEGWCVTHALWVVCLCLSIAAAAVPASNLASSARPCFLEMSCLCNYYYYHQRRPFIGCVLQLKCKGRERVVKPVAICLMWPQEKGNMDLLFD